MILNDIVEIDLAKPEDAEILAEISKRAFDSDIDVGALGPGGPEGYDSVDAHRKDAISERTDYWKAIYNDQIVGGTRVYRVSPEHCYIYGVFIDPDFHGKGIGTQFFERIEGKYPKVKKWSLDTPEWNNRTKRFYEKIGFIQTGVLRWVPTFDLRYYVKITDDDYHDEYLPISNLSADMKGLAVKGTIKNISQKKDVTSREGKNLQVASATLADETGSITLVLWNDQIRQVNKGETIVVESGYVDEFRDNLQLKVPRNGQIIIKKSV